ncbi:hypothetical protein MmiAt1_05420 [Methanimicrococcus sp. At1]|uniref:DUF7847 domain-containing protein n=1 Tax=Methanimicrococcus hacksteinii TaxID=3028293 RepID=A0ABU3VNL3_9EURY|nr:hypothetical protein [Methanimicrococcus sp. At1]MDV0444990.1 hypothetical protein [Methanimicrococcus sp. At1]
MTESMNTLLSKGWNDFKANPVLLIPSLLIMILTYAFLFAVFFAFFGDSLPLGMIFGSAVIDPAFVETFDPSSIDFGRFFLIMIVSTIAFFILSVFLTAGLTGMAKEAVTTGSTKFADLISYGARYFFKMLILNILLMLIILAFSVVVGIICGVLIAVVALLFSSTAGILFSLLLLFILIFVIMGLAIIFSMFIFFAQYALVLDNLGAVDSLKMSYNLFMNNKGDVFAFVLIMILMSVVVSMILQFVSAVLLFIPIFGLVLTAVLYVALMSIVSTLVTVWSVRKYYDLTQEKTEEPVIESGSEFSEYAEIEKGILNSDGSIVSEEIIEETIIAEDETKID